MSGELSLLQTRCDGCDEIAREPFIECCECDVNLCCSCFASGTELKEHKNNHSYAFRKNDFPLFENCNWTANEECKLLSALSTYGYGNWEEIAKCMHSRSKLECQEHYRKYYIENVQFKELNLLPETEQSLFTKPITPYLYSTEISLNPPRNKLGDQHLAGYNAQRSDFELNYDHSAESIFNIEDQYPDDQDDELTDALKVSLLSALNTRLRERQRRYNILKNHGLILPNKLISWIQLYDHMKRLHSELPTRLFSFMQFMTGMQFDAFLESLSLEAELTRHLLRLGEYRRSGIRTLRSAKLYKRLKNENEFVLKEQKVATSIMIKKFDQLSPVKKLCFGKDSNKRSRRSLMPLDIVDLPGFEMLLESEKNLCSNLRLLPQQYLDIKQQLIAENNKIGSLRLLDARRIVKIDVNKTRKIYDYLINEGYVSKPTVKEASDTWACDQ